MLHVLVAVGDGLRAGQFWGGGRDMRTYVVKNCGAHVSDGGQCGVGARSTNRVLVAVSIGDERGHRCLLKG
jgi:hypothetical protein